MLALIVSAIAAYYSYKSYYRDTEEPKPIVMFFQGSNAEEQNLSSIFVKTEQVKTVNNQRELELPLLIINDSDKDAEKLTTWVSVENEDIELKSNVNWWHCEKVGSVHRCARQIIDHLAPRSEVKLPNVIMVIKSNTKDVVLRWTIISARISPKRGELALNFQ